MGERVCVRGGGAEVLPKAQLVLYLKEHIMESVVQHYDAEHEQ